MIYMRVAVFRDGPWLPAKEGGSFGINQMIQELIKKHIKITLIRCYRGWDDINLYKKEPYTTILFREEDFYGRPEFVTNLLVNNRVDVAHFDSPEILEVYCKTLQKNNIPVVWEVHNIHSDLSKQLGFDKKKIEILKKREKAAASISDVILCRSESDRAKLLEISEVPKSKLFLYTGCIDTKPLRAVKPSKMGKHIITFGNLYYEPNKRMVLNMVDILKNTLKLDSDIRLDVVGDIPPDLRRHIASSSVKVHGFVPDITKILKHASLLVAPIDSGSGTRVKLLVAMASGIPTITTSKGAEGLDFKGKIILSDDFSEYPGLIMKLLNNRKLYDKLSREGRKFVQREYDWSNQIHKVIAAYNAARLRASH